VESGLAFPASARALGISAERSRLLARAIAAPTMALATIVVASLNEHDPYDIQAGTLLRILAGLVPLIAAALAAGTVLRPKLGLMAMLLLMPILDVAQISWTYGSIQVIDQTLFVAALAVGLALRDPEPRPDVAAEGERRGAAAASTRLRSRVTLPAVAFVAVVLMLGFATLSTLRSPNVTASAAVLLHGILEPFCIAAALLILRPTRRDLVRLMIVLAISVAVGSLLNMVQTIPAMKTLSAMQTDRLLFSRITYFNVGLFGEMLALTLPLLLALLLAHRNGYLRLNRTVRVLLVAAVPVDVAALFLSFTKSAYLASAGGCLILLLLFVHSWRRRAAIVGTVLILSAVVIPWPALVLQASPSLNQAYRNVMVTIVGQSRFDSWNPATSAGRGSLVERWYATQAGIQMALDHPLLGVSLDQFQTEYIGHYKPAQARLDLDWAHSMLPEVAAELGLPALLLDLLIYAAAMLAALRIYRSPPDPLTRLLACALIATMVGWQMMGAAFAGDMYRPWRNMASDYVVMMVLVASTFALYRLSRAGRARELPGISIGAGS
jgi:O-antigen ligase